MLNRGFGKMNRAHAKRAVYYFSGKADRPDAGGRFRLAVHDFPDSEASSSFGGSQVHYNDG
jgi:hypothetical protein